MSRMFDDFFRGVPTRFTGAEAPFGGAMPRVDVSETDNEYEVTAELPGLEENDINLQLANNVLTIRGEKKSEREEKDKNYYLSERSFGSFQRSIPLPTEVEEDQVQASFKSGVLTVRLPKTERAKSQAKRIEVKSG
jgi:HSP20 family protein